MLKVLSEEFLKKYLLHVLLGVVILAAIISIVSSWVIFSTAFGNYQAKLQASYKKINEIKATIDTVKNAITLMGDKQQELDESLNRFQERLLALRGPLQIENGIVSFDDNNTEHWVDRDGTRRNIVQCLLVLISRKCHKYCFRHLPFFNPQKVRGSVLKFKPSILLIQVLRSSGKNYRARDLELVV